MTKSAIKKELLEWNKGRPFISITEIASALKLGKDAARATVAGLEYVRHGQRKDYLVDDVAQRLAEKRHC